MKLNKKQTAELVAKILALELELKKEKLNSIFWENKAFQINRKYKEVADIVAEYKKKGEVN